MLPLVLSCFRICTSFLVQKMNTNRSDRGHVVTVGNVFCLLVVIISMIATCNGCVGGSSKTAARDKPSATPSKDPTILAPNTSASTIISTGRQLENYYCFSTIRENLTNETIERKLETLSKSGRLSGLFTDSKEESVVLKWLKQNVTGCANVTFYVIKITRENDTEDGKTSRYLYNIKPLNRSSAMKYCKEGPKCDLLTYSPAPSTSSAHPPPTTASSEVPQEMSTKETNTAERPRAPAANSGDDGVSLTIIVIPIVAALLLVVLVVVFVLWSKRRSSRRSKTKDTTSNSSVDHFAGPINGDVYTIVNPNAEKKKNKDEKSDIDLVYTELSDMGPEKPENDKAKQNEKAEYADITHILTAGDTTYENVAPQTEQAYANAIELNSENL